MLSQWDFEVFQGCLQLAQYMITTYLSVLLFENPWILTHNASMHFWITRRSYKGTSYSYYACLGRLWRPTRQFNRPDVSVQSSRRVPWRECSGVVARPHTSYWSFGTRRIRAGIGEIDAITAVGQMHHLKLFILCFLA